MADLAELDLRPQGAEHRLRALLEDLVDYHKGVYPRSPLALAVWFGETLQSMRQNLLELFSGVQTTRIVMSERQSLAWKTGSDEPPFVDIHATSVDYFAEQLGSNPESLSQYFKSPQVLYFDKRLLPETILRAFNVITEPSGLIKGWYVAADEYSKSGTVRELLGSRLPIRPSVGIVKTWESPEFETCRALIHGQFSQRWLPLSEGGLAAYTYYNDWQDAQPGYFIFQGGSLYQIVKFEVKTAPEYSDRVLEKLPDDRYPEVYLRAVHPHQQPAA